MTGSRHLRGALSSPFSAGVGIVWVGLCLAACGGGTAPRSRPTTALAAPDARDARNAAIDAFGRRAWDALSSHQPTRLLYDELDLRELLDPAGATRFSARRGSAARIGSGGVELDSARYAGICLQGAREEPANGVLGLRSRGWVFDRALVIGTRPGGRRVAAWLEGIFVFTDAGFGALDLERVEEPRWEHSDLELAPCDLAVRNDLPEAAR